MDKLWRKQAMPEHDTNAVSLGPTKIHTKAGTKGYYDRKRLAGFAGMTYKPFRDLIPAVMLKRASACCALNAKNNRCGNKRVDGTPFCGYHKHVVNRHGVIAGVNAAWTEK